MAHPGSPQDRAAFQQALALRESGRRADAARECETLVRRSPGFAPALHLLGFMALEDNNLARAAHYLPAAVRADPSDPAVHHSLGLMFRAGGKPADAAIAFRAATRVDPRHVAALNGLGLCLLDDNDAGGAERAFGAAVAVDGRHAESRHNLGLALERQGRLEEAEAQYREALAAKPDLLPSLYALGRTLLERQRPEEAEPHLREALRRNPRGADARGALALAVEALGRDGEAEELLRDAPDAAAPAIAVNLANLLARRKRYGEAIAIYDRVLAGNARDPLVCHNRANALAGLGRVDEAMQSWREAIAAAPGYPDPHFAMSRWLLARGELRQGWDEFAWRPLELPDWLPRQGLSRAGEPGLIERVRAGKVIELVEEQGLGDVVFFLQWAPWLAQQGWRVRVRVSPRLASLVARSGPFEMVRDGSASLGQEAVAIPVGDLPRLVLMLGGPERPGTLRIEPLPERLQAARQALAEAGPAPYTGLTWRAGVARRAVGRDMLSKEVDAESLWRRVDPGGTLVAMQRDARSGELEDLRRFAANVADFADWTRDLEALLGLLAAIDGYAGVSNTNVHLLAMLGRHATVAIPHPPEWRWFGDGESPWFPGFTVVRQGPGQPWPEALATK